MVVMPVVAEPAGRRDGRLLVEGADLVPGEVEPAADGAHRGRPGRCGRASTQK